MEITTANDQPLAVIAEDVVDELGSFLKDVKLHDDAAKPDQIISDAASSDNATSANSDIFPKPSVPPHKVQQEQQWIPQQQTDSTMRGLPPYNSFLINTQLEQALRHHQQQQLQGQLQGQIFQQRQQQPLEQQVAAALRDNHPGVVQQQFGNNNNINNNSSMNQHQQLEQQVTATLNQNQQQALEQQVATALRQQDQPQGNLQDNLLQCHADEQNLRALIEATL